MMLVGITGYAQHGKDTVAQALVDELGYVRLGFADALKDLALQVNPLLLLSLNHPVVYTRLADYVDSTGWEKAKKLPEVRRFLQELGTGARAVLGDDVWLKAVEHKMLEADGPVVIPDVRFPNEAEFISRWHGLLVRVERWGFDNGVDGGHDSERHIPYIPANIVLVNDGTVEDLRAQTLAKLAGITVSS